jgi:hypothetical protein
MQFDKRHRHWILFQGQLYPHTLHGVSLISTSFRKQFLPIDKDFLQKDMQSQTVAMLILHAVLAAKVARDIIQGFNIAAPKVTVACPHQGTSSFQLHGASNLTSHSTRLFLGGGGVIGAFHIHVANTVVKC